MSVPRHATVDLVIVGADAGAVDAAVDGLKRGLRVLVVMRSTAPEAARRLRRLARTVSGARPALTVLTGAEVACVDGVGGVGAVEAVVVRQVRTRRLIAFNASALIVFETGSRDTP